MKVAFGHDASPHFLLVFLQCFRKTVYIQSLSFCSLLCFYISKEFKLLEKNSNLTCDIATRVFIYNQIKISFLICLFDCI